MSYIQALRAMATLATAIGSEDDSRRYTELAEAATARFHHLHWNPRTQSYGGDAGVVQTLNIPALAVATN